MPGPGSGPVGFWDPMTITAWERSGDGGGRCEVLHLGTVVKGEGEFAVRGARRAGEPVRVGRGGRRTPRVGVGAAGWRVARPVVERVLDRGLDRMRRLVEEQAGSTRAPEPS